MIAALTILIRCIKASKGVGVGIICLSILGVASKVLGSSTCITVSNSSITISPVIALPRMNSTRVPLCDHNFRKVFKAKPRTDFYIFSHSHRHAMLASVSDISSSFAPSAVLPFAQNMQLCWDHAYLQLRFMAHHHLSICIIPMQNVSVSVLSQRY
jgi:hypothetical protein